MTPPVTEYDHDLGCSIHGGYVYRGAAYPALQGIYLYADFCSEKVWGLQNDGGWQFQHLLDSGMNISSFGQGESGESIPDGPYPAVLCTRLPPAPADQPSPPPILGSGTTGILSSPYPPSLPKKTGR